eukprot:gene10305-8236_t
MLTVTFMASSTSCCDRRAAKSVFWSSVQASIPSPCWSPVETLLLSKRLTTHRGMTPGTGQTPGSLEGIIPGFEHLANVCTSSAVARERYRNPSGTRGSVANQYRQYSHQQATDQGLDGHGWPGHARQQPSSLLNPIVPSRTNAAYSQQDCTDQTGQQHTQVPEDLVATTPECSQSTVRDADVGSASTGIGSPQFQLISSEIRNRVLKLWQQENYEIERGANLNIFNAASSCPGASASGQALMPRELFFDSLFSPRG